MEDASGDVLGRQVARLRRIDVCTRWLMVALLWLTLGTWSCWEMRDSLSLLSEYLSWTGLRYSIFFHLWGGGGGLIFCVGMTISSLIWQIFHSFGRLSPRERHRLEVRVQKIQEKGPKHLLWRWIQVN